MHVNQVRLAEKTDSISWEEQPSEWTAQIQAVMRLKI